MRGFDPVFEREFTNDTSDFRFLTSSTSAYRVTSLPEVPYDVGELYSGNIPISSNDTDRTLFFVFQPTIGEPVDEVTIWLNGGPGCSSLEGFLQENGLFVWLPGTLEPTINPYSWVNLTNMLWVDQPVGTGFSTGTPTADSQEDIAADFAAWFLNWQKTFGISNFKIYISGESYAGRYIPYISSAFLDKNDTTHYDLSGAIIYDPCIGDCGWVQEEVPAVPFVLENSVLFNLNESFTESLIAAHDSCGYADYLEQYLTFPTGGIQPISPGWADTDACDVWDLIDEAVLAVNPCFDIYDINQACPLPWDVLGFPTQLEYVPAGYDLYFNRTDVKTALHAPQYIDWTECSNENVFVGGDNSAQPNLYVLPKLIEATNRVLIANGDYDFILPTNGTLLSIQNMTWNGELGFQSQPSTPIDIEIPDLAWASVFDENYATGIDGPQGIMGIQHYERGLLWAEVYQSGHMQPEYQPRVAYRHLEWLLNRTQTL